MEGHELLAKMNRVEAPSGFEEAVLTKLPAARKERARVHRANFRYAFAGSAILVLVGFVLLNPPLFRKESILTFAEREAPTVPSIPVFETMDYASEFRNAQAQPRTVYILEQVSESVSSEIIY
ncbi:MAG: hypothetical protein IMZ54_07090 [Acidobacteria bacterium]|nr:hypothetical protein [Acidobacteriota bacterium]MBE3130470.1 hypothetical protein [Acidobacteriota bacterium]